VSPSEQLTGSKPVRRRRPRLIALLVVLLWVGVIGGVAGPFSGRLAEVQQNDNTSFLPVSAEATQALELQEGFGDSDSLPTIVVYERTSGLTQEDLELVAEDASRIDELGVTRGAVSPPIPSQDGQAVQLFLLLDGADVEEIPVVVQELRDLVDRPELDAYVTGVGGLSADLFEVFGTIDSTLILATATVVIVILLVVYRSPWLWALPLLSVALAFSLAAAVIYLLAREDVLVLSGQSQGILTVLVFGAGTDYALLLIARYREELHTHEHPWDAMRVAWRGAVPAILASGGTVVLGLLCLLASDLNSNRSLGPVAALGIVAAVLSMITLLPALLVLVGRRVFWPRVPTFTGFYEEGSGLWRRVSATVGRRPRRTALLTGGGLVVLALFATQLSASGISQEDTFTTEVQSVAGQAVVEAHYPAGSGVPVVVIGAADATEQLTQVLSADPDVAEVVTQSEAPGGPPLVVDGRVLLNATLSVAGDGTEAQDVVRRLRTSVDAADPDAVVGGFTAVNLDVQTAAQRDNVVIIPLILVMILIVLGLLLRAVVAPVMLIATVVLSYLATLGVCAFFFNEVFGFAGADSSFPLYAFVFLVALGIDYNIFLMTRVREETQRLGSTRAGTLKGLAVTGGVITSAGVVLAATFAVLGVLPLVFLAELGFAVAFGVLLDTLIVRSLLVPALTLQIGDRVWWPSALARPSAEQPGRDPRLPVPVDAPG